MIRASIGFALFLLIAHVDPAIADTPADRVDQDGDALPAGVVARLGSGRLRHGTRVVHLRFLEDGTKLLSAPDGAVHSHTELRVWDSETGKLLRTITVPKQSAKAMAVSPDEKTVASRGFFFDQEKAEHAMTLKLLDLGSEQVRSFKIEGRGGRDPLVFSSDGTTILTGSDRLQIWDAAAGVELLSYQLSSRRINTIAASTNGKTVAIGTGQGLFLWDMTSGDAPKKTAITGNILRVEFAPDGSTLAVSGDSRTGVFTMDPETGKRLRQFVPVGDYTYTTTMRFSPNGELLAIPEKRRRAISVYEASSGKLRHRFECSPATPSALAFTPDSKRLAGAIGHNGAIRIWDVASGKRMLDREGHTSSPSCLAVFPDGERVASAGDDGVLLVWNVKARRVIHSLRHSPKKNSGSYAWIRALAVSPDGKLIASSALDDAVNLWDAITGRRIYRLPGHGELGGFRALAFSSDSKQLASFGDDRYLRVWDVRTGKALAEHDIWPDDMKRPDREAEEAGSEDPFGPFAPANPDGCGLSNDARTLWIGMNRGKYLFNVNSGKQTQKLEAPSSYTPGVAFAPNQGRLFLHDYGPPVETKLAGGGTRHHRADYTLLQVYDVKRNAMANEKKIPHPRAGTIALSPDGKLLALSEVAPSTAIRLYDATNLTEVATLTKVDGYPAKMAFSHDGKQLITGMSDTTILVWDVAGFR